MANTKTKIVPICTFEKVTKKLRLGTTCCGCGREVNDCTETHKGAILKVYLPKQNYRFIYAKEYSNMEKGKGNAVTFETNHKKNSISCHNFDFMVYGLNSDRMYFCDFGFVVNRKINQAVSAYELTDNNNAYTCGHILKTALTHNCRCFVNIGSGYVEVKSASDFVDLVRIF